MATNTHIGTAAAAVVLVAAMVLASSTRPAAAASAGASCGGTRTLLAAGTAAALRVTRTLGHTAHVRPAYDWPLKPFDRQHPVRAFLDDPRIGAHGSRAFHFGIDVAGRDGAAVYAVEGGLVYLGSAETVAVKTGPHHVFGYWHVVPAVADRQFVTRHQLLGHIARGWGHVHFAERFGSIYLNPLRRGGIGPYTDPIAPSIREISLARLNAGGIEVLANAFDTTWPHVPGPWAREPVAPALLQWRLFRSGEALGGWRTAADFRNRMLDARLFTTIYAAPTAQNHEGLAGIYCFHLGHAWDPADGSYRVEVAASDTRRNRAVAWLEFKVAHGQVQT